MQETIGSYHIFTVYNQDIAFPSDTPRSVVDHNLTDFAQALRKKALSIAARNGIEVHGPWDDAARAEGKKTIIKLPRTTITRDFVRIAPPGLLVVDPPAPASNDHFFVRDKPASWRPPPEDFAAGNDPEPEVAAALKDYQPYSRRAVIFAAWGPIVLPPIGLMAAALVGMWVMRGFMGRAQALER
jgi:hypothetical protein